MCDIVFEKSKGSWWDSKQNECLCKSSCPKGFFKKSVVIKFAEFTRKHLRRNLFFDKVKLCRSATSLKTSL